MWPFQTIDPLTKVNGGLVFNNQIQNASLYQPHVKQTESYSIMVATEYNGKFSLVSS